MDDEPVVLTTIAALLRAAGHTVLEAADGAAALALLAKEPLDLAFTDLGMPDMNGWDLAREIKARRPDLPVVLLTGWRDPHRATTGAGGTWTPFSESPYALATSCASSIS